MSASPAPMSYPRWPLPAAWSYFGLYACWAGAMLAGAAPRGLLNDLIFLPLYLGAGLAAWSAARRQVARPRTARGWQLVAAAWLVSAVAAIMMVPLWLVPLPWLDTLSSGIYQLYFPLLLLGFWQFIEFPRGTAARVRLVVEGLIAVTGTVILAWFWIFRFGDTGRSLFHSLKIILVMFPGEIAVALGAVAIMHRPAEAGARRALSLLSVGTLAAVVADLVYEYDLEVGGPWSGPTGDLLLALAAAFVMTACLSTRRDSREEPHPAVALGPALVPYLAIGAVGALALCELWRPDLQHPALPGLVLGEVVLMGLLIARLVLAQLEFVTEAGARAAQDARFRALVQQSSDAILVVSRDGRLSYASPPFAAMVGLAETDLTGRELRDLVTVESPGGLEAWLADPGMQPLSRWTVGDQRHIEALATDHTADPGIGGVVINARDISERVRLEAQLRQAQKLEAVGRFASSVAHDFNNVLTVITANLHFLRDDRPGEGREELAQMEVAAARGATLASQLTALSRPRAGAAPAVDLAGAVRAIQRTLDVLLPSSIQTTVTAPATGAMVRLDEVQVEQLLLNLALNSRDAMLEGGRLDITLAVTDPPPDEPVESDARWARLDVRDTGSGMSAEVMQQALEPFFTTKDSSRGTGLGLYSVRSIVSGAGGRVDLASEPGVGTTVTLWLPLVLARASRTRPRAEQASPRGEGRVLVVDDEAAVRRILVRQLTKAGYEVVEREDGQAAFEYLQAHDGAADLVLTDLVMPRMSGQELASRISERWPQIRLLIMSGTPDVLAGRREAWARIPVIAKPLGLADVAARVAAALRTDGVSREEPSVPG